MNQKILKDRTKHFAIKVIGLTENLPQNHLCKHIKSESIRCSTSVAANY